MEDVRELIMSDRYVTYSEIEEPFHITKTTINKISHEHLGFFKKIALNLNNLTSTQTKYLSIMQENVEKMCSKFIKGYVQHIHSWRIMNLSISPGNTTSIGCIHSFKMSEIQLKLFEEESHRSKCLAVSSALPVTRQ